MSDLDAYQIWIIIRSRQTLLLVLYFCASSSWKCFVFLFCLKVCPQLAPLMITIKACFQQNDINCARYGTLSSYNIALLIIHYLQCEYTWSYTCWYASLYGYKLYCLYSGLNMIIHFAYDKYTWLYTSYIVSIHGYILCMW